MANSSSDSLHELIKNLNKTEKRFFKLYAGRHTIGEENISIILFDFIAKMKRYDESVILNHFKGQSFLNKFSITKYRLYQQILESLNQYHSKSLPEYELLGSLQSAKILFQKGMYKQSRKLTDSIIKKANKYHFENIKLQAIQLLKKYHEQYFYTNISFDDLEKLKLIETNVQNEIELKAIIWHVKSKLFKQINSFGTIRSNEQIKALAEIVKPLFEIVVDNKNLESQYLYFHTLSAYYFAIHNTKECYNNLLKVKEIYDSNIELVKKSFGKYMSVLTNLTYACIKLKFYKQAQNNIIELEKNQHRFTKSNDLEIKYFSSYYSLRLFILIEQGEDEKASEILDAIHEGLSKYKDKINPVRRAYLYFQIGVYQLAHHQYKSALESINFVVSDRQNLANEDIYSFAQIVQLIIHFELKNHRYLPYILTSTKRFLKEKNRLYRFEALFLKIIGKIKSENISDIELEEILFEFRPEINAIKEDKFEKSAFEYFDFSAWLSSKIERKSYLDIKKVSA